MVFRAQYNGRHFNQITAFLRPLWHKGDSIRAVRTAFQKLYLGNDLFGRQERIADNLDSKRRLLSIAELTDLLASGRVTNPYAVITLVHLLFSKAIGKSRDAESAFSLGMLPLLNKPQVPERVKAVLRVYISRLPFVDPDHELSSILYSGRVKDARTVSLMLSMISDSAEHSFAIEAVYQNQPEIIRQLNLLHEHPRLA
jgi:hypothetical protein